MANNAAAAPTAQSQQRSTATDERKELTLNISKKLKGQPLKYPQNLNKNFRDFQSFIRFKSYDFSEVQSSQEIYSVGNSGIFKLFEDSITTITGSMPKMKYSNDQIDLYVPSGINVGYGANWGEASLGAIPATGEKQDGFDITNYLESFFQGFGTGFSKKALDTLATTMSSGSIPGFSATGDDLLGLTTGLVFNQNSFSTFQNIKVRTFNYSFIFVARNTAEKNNINRIINVFKIAMHPAGTTLGASGTATSNNGGGSTTFTAVPRPPILKYPKLWTIEYRVRSGINKFLPRTKFCALTDVAINYTPNGAFSALIDGQPIAVQMDINFKELTPLIADQIVTGDLLGAPFNGSGINGDDYTPLTKGLF